MHTYVKKSLDNYTITEFDAYEKFLPAKNVLKNLRKKAWDVLTRPGTTEGIRARNGQPGAISNINSNKGDKCRLDNQG